jgi:hypothetical protein
MECRDDTRRSIAPVVASYGKTRKPKGVRQIEHVLTQGGLLAPAWLRRLTKPGGTKPAKIGDDGPIPRLNEARHDLIPRPGIIGPSVQEDHWKPLRFPGLLNTNCERLGIDEAQPPRDLRPNW